MVASHTHWINSIEIRIGDTPVTGGPQAIAVNTVCNSPLAGVSGRYYHRFKCKKPISGRYLTLQKIYVAPGENWDVNELYFYVPMN